ncbi:carbamoyl-phosphate synthase large subunit, partial [Lacticaseibacillus saniviri]|nr:carbamoyl-phosphate synthase large subunit [Lacticaseibacillus saniviri]
VMGSDQTLAKALYKAFEAAHTHLPAYGTVLFTIADPDKAEAVGLAKRFREIGYRIVATAGTAETFADNGIQVTPISKLGEGTNQNAIPDAIADRKLSLVINTMTTNQGAAHDGLKIRQAAIDHGVPLMTSLDTADAILKVLESRAFTTQSI